MTEDHQVSNDNRVNNKAAKRMFKKSTYADASETLKNSHDQTKIKNGEVVDWMNFFPVDMFSK